MLQESLHTATRLQRPLEQEVEPGIKWALEYCVKKKIMLNKRHESTNLVINNWHKSTNDYLTTSFLLILTSCAPKDGQIGTKSFKKA